MIIKFDMNSDEAEKAETFASANLISFFKDSEGKYFTSNRMIELMNYNQVKTSIIEEIPSEKIKLFHKLSREEHNDCMKSDEDVLRAFGYVNGFNLLIHIDDKAISEHADKLQALGSRFFNYGSYIWCGLNSKYDDPTKIYNLLLLLFSTEGEQMFKSI